MHPDPTAALQNLRRAIDRLPPRKPRQRGDPRSLAMAQIELINKQLDGADAIDMLAFALAFEAVFPGFCEDEDEDCN